jgi:SAM-dependent methyltransferase
MPDVEHNRSVWAEGWDWAAAGDDWSEWWGGTETMWHAALWPRLQAFLPAGTVLEIAPGYGRWTQYLQRLAERLVIVDMTPACIEHCRSRFSAATNIEYHVNDGRSLELVEDGTIDVMFSFDSLVHVDDGVLEAYLRQLRTKLRPDGVGILHHSNCGEHRAMAALSKRAPVRWRRQLMERGLLLDLGAWRDSNMTAARFRELCAANGLVCVGQETLSWQHGRFLTDAISIFTLPGSTWERPYVLERNGGFSAEGRRMRTLWGARSFGRTGEAG